MELIREYETLPESIKCTIQNANVFFTENYWNYIRKTGNRIVYVFDEQFILPVAIYQKMKIKYAMYVSEYFELQKGATLAQKKEFLEEVQLFLKKKERIAWISTSAAAFFDVYPRGSKRIPFGSHVIDMSLDMEILWKNVHTKHRNSIRRAEKGEVSIKSGGKSLLNDYLKLDTATWARSDKNSYGQKFFEKIIEGMRENAIIFIAYKDKVPQSGACYFLNKEMCYYMYGASSDNPESGSTNYMHWEVIKYLKDKGIKKYSFVGCRIEENENSKYHSIQRFKERFGGILVRGYMFKTVLIPWKYSLFRILYKIKNRQPMIDAIDQEIGKWGELNVE